MPWWTLEITGTHQGEEITDASLEQIAELIKEGFNQGEVLWTETAEERRREEENEKVRTTDVDELPLLLGSLEFDSSRKILSDRLQSNEEENNE